MPKMPVVNGNCCANIGVCGNFKSEFCRPNNVKTMRWGVVAQHIGKFIECWHFSLKWGKEERHADTE